MRKVTGLTHKPADHAITIIAYEGGLPPGSWQVPPDGATRVVREELPSLLCDLCGNKITDGAPAVAVTFWRGAAEPAPWEAEYLTPPAVDPVLQPLVDHANAVAIQLP